MDKYLKNFLVGLLCLVSGSVLFGGVKFTVAPEAPLFREYLADPYATSTKFHIFTLFGDENIPETLLAVHDGKYEEFRFVEGGKKAYFNFRIGANIGLLRLEAGFFQIEGFLSGAFNSVFEMLGHNENLGFDGVYGVGASIRLWDVVALQGGIHHFSGHWGDEVLSMMAKHYRDDPGFNFGRLRMLEYTRDNSWLASISVEPNEKFRFYFSAELPMQSAWIRPGAHVPFTTTYPYPPHESQHQFITGGEKVTTTIEYPDSYKAWRLQTGTEIRLPAGKTGSLFFAGDIQFHQDGKTLHQIDGYDDANPWEITFDIGLGFEFNRGMLNRKFRFEAYYHNGRFPLLNYFYKRTHYVTVGLAVSG